MRWPQKWKFSVPGSPSGHLHMVSFSASSETWRLIGTTTSSIGTGDGSRRGAGLACVFSAVLPDT